MTPAWAFGALCVLAVASASSVLRVTPNTPEQLDVLKAWYEGDSAAMDFWYPPTDVGRRVDIMTSRVDEMRAALEAARMKPVVFIADVDKLAAEQLLSNSGNLTKDGKQSCVDKYTTYAETVDWLKALEREYSDIATLISIGKTLQGNDIHAIRINTNGQAKPGYYVDGGIHAREWIAPAVAKNILLNLLEGHRSGSPDVKRMVESFEWTVVPVLNVDGYLYTWTTDRMWRKTRRPNPGGSFGVDANRNSDVEFGRHGSSTNPASETYPGPFAFSEPCVKSTVDYMAAMRNIKAYWNLHSYGEEIIVPYAYSSTIIPPDRNSQLAAGRLLHQAIQARSGKVYDGPRRPNSLYSGFLMDYAYRNVGIKYSGLIELPDKGQYGFLLPATQICTTSADIWAGIMAHAQYVLPN